MSGSRTSVLTVLGLAIVVVGWLILLAGLIVGDQMLRAGSLVATMTTRADVITIAQTAIATGLGLAIIGALRSGFGDFGRFFDAVLQRSTAQRTTSVPERSAPVVNVTPYERDTRDVRENRDVRDTRDMRDGREPPAPPPPLRAKERNYVVLPDGSVEVETMFGTRIFATLDEAREFIR